MSQEPRQAKKMERDWYSVSVVSAKRTFQLLIFVVLVIGAAAFYQQWENGQKRQLAADLIEEATELTARLQERGDYEQVRRAYYRGWDSLESARSALEEQRYPEAVSLGRESRARTGRRDAGRHHHRRGPGTIHRGRGQRRVSPE